MLVGQRSKTALPTRQRDPFSGQENMRVVRTASSVQRLRVVLCRELGGQTSEQLRPGGDCGSSLQGGDRRHRVTDPEAEGGTDSWASEAAGCWAAAQGVGARLP